MLIERSEHLFHPPNTELIITVCKRNMLPNTKAKIVDEFLNLHKSFNSDKRIIQFMIN